VPRGDKSAYTEKQKRQAAHIAAGYRRRGLPRKVAEMRAWATINKIYGGGELRGSGRGKPVDRSVYARAGKPGGPAARARPKAAKARSAGRAARSRARNRRA
jgi:hypothetical protein